MIENLVNGTVFQQGLFVSIIGILGVFIVLIVFYFLIVLLGKILPDKQEE